MQTKEFLILALIGLSAGILSGFFGLGGGIIIVPALVFFLKMNQHQAQGTSLAMLLPPIGFWGAWEYYQKGALNLNYAVIIALFFTVGAWAGASLALKSNPKKIQLFFMLYLTLSAFKLIFS